jgi:hypothetical protein
MIDFLASVANGALYLCLTVIFGAVSFWVSFKVCRACGFFSHLDEKK